MTRKVEPIQPIYPIAKQLPRPNKDISVAKQEVKVSNGFDAILQELEKKLGLKNEE
ncbi:hypothetical protein PP175_25980 (plasmid) [Aneurinibacillus sp. Ricciae_BoGa-3]|uniref:hypothetical protein n=1 Tax=Aneurinibacillus sp. Ricciae_BoGa-3 TaxID=3022697 RepID=UPI0023412A7C|nr:hypothetical protein [Aneurinibacillus sp. Ricciae_BoGa-3]WCK57519.1 hypothetical protein PP175_25980 [Aneurinibacillus sp. Ricciae_BoGa-3]